MDKTELLLLVVLVTGSVFLIMFLGVLFQDDV
jgi:hypothetical protein